MKRNTYILAATALSACASCVTGPTPEEYVHSMYNVQESGISEFDGMRYVRMKNIACNDGAAIPIFFDLYQDTRQTKDRSVLLKLKVTRAEAIKSGESLHFNIDDEFFNVATDEAVTNYETVFPSVYVPPTAIGTTYIPSVYAPSTNASSKIYIVSEELIQRLAKARKIVVRADLNQSSIEAKCSPSDDTLNDPSTFGHDLTGSFGFMKFSEMMLTLK